MSWLARLYETYEYAKDAPDGKALMPISHTIQNAHINIVIDGEGNFLRASVLEKTPIVLPATESSASRSSGEAPHALADKIQYVAGDYAAFGGKKSAYFDGYKNQLTAWCDSELSNQTIKSVLAYVTKQTVVADLIAYKILHAHENILLMKWNSDEEQPPLFKSLPKEKGLLDQGSALVCWTVERSGSRNDTWEDEQLQQHWIDFDSLNSGNKGLCFVTGESLVLASNHPAKIRHSGDKAKLISANDMSGFTFRGRFTDSATSVKAHGYQSVGVSFEVTQKAHNVLRWLISRQASGRNGDQVFLSWASSAKETPDPMADMFDMLKADYVEPAEDHSANVGQDFALKLKEKMQGYLSKGNLEAHECISIIGLDSATPGRMGVIYYRETFAQEFIDILQQWYLDFSWPQRQKITIDNGQKKPFDRTSWPTVAPVPYKIWGAVYGAVITDTLKKNSMERLIPCIVEGKNIPLDFVMNSVKRATNRVAYKSDETWLWEQNLGIACALYKGFCKRTTEPKYKKEYQMALEENNNSRDYLYGRLLAVAEKIESIALKVADENRITTAERLMQRFSERPYSTWRNIELALKPYMQRLQNSRTGFLINRKKELDEILNAFEPKDFMSEKPLTGEFLLGFHCQRLVLNEKKETAVANNESVNREL